VIDFAGAGLGLQYGTVRLVRSDASWAFIALELAEDIRKAVAGSAQAVEHIGSTAVPGLLAKPIIDLAIGVAAGVDVTEIAGPMSRLRWIYRGDAGGDGGWVFVMEGAPWRRVAHAHGVEFGGPEWVRYLEFRELLRRNPTARRDYETTKERVATEHPDGRQGYTAGKSATVSGLLRGNA
jgi:GrpB-like predicted nucleotidyltransferase (UPF0157 family)